MATCPRDPDAKVSTRHMFISLPHQSLGWAPRLPAIQVSSASLLCYLRLCVLSCGPQWPINSSAKSRGNGMGHKCTCAHHFHSHRQKLITGHSPASDDVWRQATSTQPCGCLKVILFLFEVENNTEKQLLIGCFQNHQKSTRVNRADSEGASPDNDCQSKKH